MVEDLFSSSLPSVHNKHDVSFVCMVSACFLITIHHILKNPYRDPLANKVETLSLSALSTIAVINLAKATLMSFGTAIDGPVTPYLEVLDWFQVCSLGFVPVFISMLFTFCDSFPAG